MMSISRFTGVVFMVLTVVISGTQLIPTVRAVQLTHKVDSPQKVPVIRTVQLTADGPPYRLISSSLQSEISVYNVESGRNNREMSWNDNVRESSSAVQCAIWLSGSGIAQNGFVFRIARQSGGYNAVVFARNIFMNWYWRFAPKMFHTGNDYDYEWSDVPGIDLDTYLGRGSIDTWPLRVCASLDSNNVLRFAVAKGFDPMPPLSNPGIQGGSWELDMSEYYHPGEGLKGKNNGTFVGHIPNGTSLDIGGNFTLNGQSPLNSG